MNDSTKQIYEWINGTNIVASLVIDDNDGMKLTFSSEIVDKVVPDLKDLLTLSMYPPKDETKMAGVPVDHGKYVEYEIKKGTKWEAAKIDMANTFRFWFGDMATERTPLER